MFLFFKYPHFLSILTGRVINMAFKVKRAKLTLSCPSVGVYYASSRLAYKKKEKKTFIR